MLQFQLIASLGKAEKSLWQHGYNHGRQKRQQNCTNIVSAIWNCVVTVEHYSVTVSPLKKENIILCIET